MRFFLTYYLRTIYNRKKQKGIYMTDHEKDCAETALNIIKVLKDKVDEAYEEAKAIVKSRG